MARTLVLRNATFAGSVLAACLLASTSSASAGAPPDAPGYTTARTGGAHDFEYFAGGWRTTQHRLKARGVGSNEWDTFPATLCMTPYLDGRVTADEIRFPTKGWAGFTLRSYDLAKKQWSVWWINSTSGRLETPVVGGFDGARGEFYGEDVDDGRPVKVRYRWDKVDHDRARWEQAFSYDGGAWETNWTADFVRADAATACSNGRPRD